MITLSFSGSCSPGHAFRIYCPPTVYFKTPNAIFSRLGDLGLVCLVPPPLPKDQAANPSASHRLPLSSLSLALIRRVCNESYLKPTKTSSTSAPNSEGEDPQEEGGLQTWGACAALAPSDPQLSRVQTLTGLSPLETRSSVARFLFHELSL